MREYGIVFLIGVAVCFSLTPACRSLALRLGAVARVRGRDVHSSATPYFGGLAMLGGLGAAYLMASKMPFLSRYPNVLGDSLFILAAAGVMCVIGLIDDVIELNAMMKIAGQMLAAGILVVGGVQMRWIPWKSGIIVLDQAAGILISLLFIFLCTNAVNLIDGLDGLAAGIVAISGSAFFIYAYWLTVGEGLVRATTSAFVTIAMCGICLGYLPHNFHPAKIFMGDSGAMLLGLLFAASTISLTGQIDPTTLSGGGQGLFVAYIPLVLPLVALGLPFLDMFVAYTRRTWEGVWWFVADKQHLHHRLLQRGHSHLRAVMMMYAWTALLAYSAMFLGLFPSWLTLIIAGVALVSTLVFVLFTGRKTTPEDA
ncbi:MAG: undecaprenyl/decaprenyl-phosphate alpha-N-acetylglucosaminyl 1-phosphate transferase [Propionibacteriaceae bacterium]|jgi:UDP-GlcNAc:undecaprenyl-phosphate GlcNAc-1-phosphate transferase|nr:undecaprenyl/decaprenyl-phosphate alpha-N-acetylglucosaminyl 1-phosphate transferase [Propionibacteriaceae bacterium]